MDIAGTWELVRWTSLKDGKENGYPLGEDATGRIIYTTDGHMSAFMMRAGFESKDQTTTPTPEDFIAYSADWQIEGDQVTHEVKFATLPHWIGTPLVRTMDRQDDTHLLLKTIPETSKSGKVYEHHLLWRKVA